MQSFFGRVAPVSRSCRANSLLSEEREGLGSFLSAHILDVGCGQCLSWRSSVAAVGVTSTWAFVELPLPLRILLDVDGALSYPYGYSAISYAIQVSSPTIIDDRFPTILLHRP